MDFPSNSLIKGFESLHGHCFSRLRARAKMERGGFTAALALDRNQGDRSIAILKSHTRKLLPTAMQRSNPTSAPDHADAWPWPAKSGLAVTRHDEPLAFGRKTLETSDHAAGVVVYGACDVPEEGPPISISEIVMLNRGQGPAKGTITFKAPTRTMSRYTAAEAADAQGRVTVKGKFRTTSAMAAFKGLTGSSALASTYVSKRRSVSRRPVVDLDCRAAQRRRSSRAAPRLRISRDRRILNEALRRW